MSNVSDVNKVTMMCLEMINDGFSELKLDLLTDVSGEPFWNIWLHFDGDCIVFNKWNSSVKQVEMMYLAWINGR